jgi:hypothetical protein
MERMQHLCREFARMQNAFNWSRRVQLEWDKANHRLEPQPEDHNRDIVKTVTQLPSAGGASVPASRAPVETNTPEIIEVVAESEPTPKRQGAGALQDAPRIPEPQEQRASVLDCGSPLPLSETNSQTPQLLNSQTPRSFQPLPTVAPTTPTPNSYLQTPNPPPPRPTAMRAPMRGRRFVCIEG